MTRPLPKWEMEVYSILWNKYDSKDFSHNNACTLLKQKKGVVSVLLSDMKKAGWIEVKLDPHDSRKRTYLLKSPSKAIKEMIK